MTTTDVEEIATSKIKNLIFKNNDCLRAFINENDKTPLWDGNIYIYNDDQKKNSSYSGKIDVQIKGHETDRFEKNRTFQIEIDTLKGYQKEIKGTLFFVVDIIDVDTYQVYYCNLLPVDLFQILANIKENQKSCNLKLKMIENNDYLTFKNICLNFWKNLNKQAGKEILNEDSFSEIESINAVYCKTDDFYKQLVDGNVYTYAKLKNSDKEFSMIRPEKWIPFKEIKKDIIINNKKYYSSYTVYGEIAEEIIINKVNINIRENRVSFDFKGNIYERIKTLEFVLALLKNKYIYFGNVKLNLPFDNLKEVEKNIELYQNDLKYLYNMQKVFKVFNLHLDISYEDLTNNDLKQIDILINLYNGKFSEKIKNLHKYYITFNKYKLVFIIFMAENTILNFYSKKILDKIEFSYKNNNTMIKGSINCILRYEDMIDVYNFNDKSIIKSFKNIELTDAILDTINNMILMSINAYDATNEKKYLNLADKLSQITMKNRKDDIDVINAKQIKYRKQGL